MHIRFWSEGTFHVVALIGITTCNTAKGKNELIASRLIKQTSYSGKSFTNVAPGLVVPPSLLSIPWSSVMRTIVSDMAGAWMHRTYMNRI